MPRPFLAAALSLILVASPATRAADHVAIEAQFAGFDALASGSPKDEFLRVALKALGPRIAQLSGEFGEDPREALPVAAFWESMRGHKYARLVFNDDDPAHPRVRLFVEIVPAEPEKGADMVRAMAYIAEEAGATTVDVGPMHTFNARTGDTITYGLSDGKFMIAVNGLDHGGAPAGTISSAPADVPLLLRVHIDGPVISKLLGMIPQHDPADAAKGFAALKALGLYGEGAMSLDVGAWNVGKGLEGTATFRKLHSVSFPGVNPPPTLGEAFLSMIPADATTVQASVMDFGVFERAITAADPGARAEIAQQSTQFLGFDIWGDFLAHLGPRFAWYQSDRTGGAGMMSTVMIAELKDPAAFGAAHAKLIEKINGFGAGMARGYVRIDSVDVAGQASFLLHAPGLPLPIAPMWAIVGNTVIAGATPVAFHEALAIAKAKGPNITTNPAVRERLGTMGANAAGIAYCDTPRVAKDAVGAGTALLIMAANAAKISPAATTPALPTPAAFLEGVRPCVGWSGWSGDDLVCRWSCDSSLTVLGAVAVSQYANVGLVQVMSMVGTVMPAVGRAETAGPLIKSGVNVEEILSACTAWENNTNGALPPSLDALLEQNIVRQDAMFSPLGRAERFKYDYVLRTDIGSVKTLDQPSETILVVDAGALQAGNSAIFIGFADGHHNAVTRDELDVLLNQPQNLGMRQALGID